jgi:Icc-related predicted phosphoesterase
VATHAATVLYARVPPIADELAEMSPPTGPWVFVAHAPPFDTALDQSHDGRHQGSRSIRSAIERHRPMLSLHGHVKESPRVSGTCQHRFDSTLSVNVGQQTAVLNYAVIQVDVVAGRVVAVEHGHQA